MKSYPKTVVPAGSVLFHGSIEKIRGRLRPGGDGVLWFADTPSIAQLYLPRSGRSMIVGVGAIVKPSRDEDIVRVQKAVGIEYAPDAAIWDEYGRLKSYFPPKGLPPRTDMNYDGPAEVDNRLQALGYTPTNPGVSPWSKSYEFHFADDRLLPPGGKEEGVLCVATPRRDLVLWRKAEGEGDLTAVQYHDVRGFDRARRAGLDGVIIDDFAQSEEWGNLGHLSVGLFAEALPDLDVECIPATYEEYEPRKYQTEAYPHRVEPWFRTLLTRAPNRPVRRVKKLKNRLMR